MHTNLVSRTEHDAVTAEVDTITRERRRVFRAVLSTRITAETYPHGPDDLSSRDRKAANAFGAALRDPKSA